MSSTYPDANNPTDILTRIAGLASAGGALFGLSQDWLVPTGLGGLLGDSSNAFDLISNGFPIFWPLLITIAGTFISIGVIAYSLARTDEYARYRKTLALLRGICAIIAILPIFYATSWIGSFDPTQYVDGRSLDSAFTSLVLLLTQAQEGPGPSITWITLVLLGLEALIDYFRK